MKLKDFGFSNLLATDFAKYKDWWWRWFDIFAKRYYLKFLASEKKLSQIIKQLEQNSIRTNKEIAKMNRINDYLALFQAMKVKPSHYVEINEEIMNNFQKIDNQNELTLTNDAVYEIEKEIQIKDGNDDEKFQLEDLYKIVISFYKDEKIRKDFYMNSLTKEKKDFDYDCFLPVDNEVNFNNVL